jgi:hypothetical protein
LEEAVCIGISKNMTPEIFREAANYVKNKTLTLDSISNFAFLKKYDKLIFSEVEIAVKN